MVFERMGTQRSGQESQLAYERSAAVIDAKSGISVISTPRESLG